MLKLETPLEKSKLPTLTLRAQKRLKDGLGIETVRDLCFHLPVRYKDRETLVPIQELKPGITATIVGKVEQTRVGRAQKKKLHFAETKISDPTGTLQIMWFRQPWMAERFTEGDRVLCTGKTTKSYGRLYMANPDYEILKQSEDMADTLREFETAQNAADIAKTPLVPIYPETHGITSRWLNFLIRKALERLDPSTGSGQTEELPAEAREKLSLPPLKEALERIHLPQEEKDAEKAKSSLLLRELFVLQCAVLLARAKRNADTGIAVTLNAERISDFLKTLPFSLTDSQRITAYEILRDMEKARPMHRLLVGDVGSGKTVVAAIAALNVIASGKGQAALMAPTEVLAKQHFRTLTETLNDHGVRIALLTGSESRVTPKRITSEQSIRISKPKLHKEVAAGKVDLLVGTHALISKPKGRRKSTLKPKGALSFKRLLLAIIDEQHRFGVMQRKRMEDVEAFAQSENTAHISPHLLTLTATPIPRTLALTIFGDLDISLITELPKGRKRVKTAVISPAQETKAFDKIREEAAEGHQAFVICPLVSPSEKIEAKAAEEEYERLKEDVFPNLTVGLLHGRMKTKEKDEVMQKFKKQKLDVLVATPVVEVGIDVPNATVMVIEGAERFGLAQLYQFRGRVGRSDLPSFCFLVTEGRSAATKKRLKAMMELSSGKDISRVDLQIRGPGELVGTQQSGFTDTLMQAMGNLDLIQEAREAAKEFLSAHPLKEFPALARRVRDIREELHLS